VVDVVDVAVVVDVVAIAIVVVVFSLRFNVYFKK
jgi:hypothetical protein